MTRIELSDEVAEKNVLGSILLDGKTIASIADTLSPSDFNREKWGWVYEACLNVFNQSKNINEVTVAHEIERMGRLEEAGGSGILPSLVAECVNPYAIEDYAKIVSDFSAKRTLLKISKAIEDLAYQDDIEKSYGDAVGLLLQVKMANQKDALQFPQDRAEFALNRYTELYDGKKETLLSFGLPSLDEMGGMEGGEVLVISGKTGEGKTTFAKQVARHVWKKYGFVLYISLEMPEHQDIDKDMARITGEYVLKIQRGHYSEEMYGKLISGTGQLKEENIVCYYPIRGTLANIYAVARRVQAQVGLRFMVLDYIQLLENARGGAMLEERISNISRNLKYMARDLDIPIMALSRMTRDSNADDINRLYGSGSLEYDADWVMFMKADIENNKATLTIAKHRQGGVRGKFELGYNWEKQNYYELTDRKERE